MEAKDLPHEMAELKKDISKLILAFNNRVGLDITEVHIAPIMGKELDGSQRPISYDVGIGMDF